VIAISVFFLAYRPFLDPLNMQRTWFFLLLPMALFISIAYKAVRVVDMQDYWRQVLVMTMQLVLAIVGLGAALFFVVQYVLPLILPVE
jgi:hypothetical protein